MSGFLDSPKGRVLTVVMVVAILGATGWSIWSSLRANPAVEEANDPTFINAETGKVFRMKVTAGMSYPVVCPDTGKPTGYEAEFCYWTKDGHVKDVPTPVLLNTYLGKPEPTFCPDCGRLVIQRNPIAIEGHRPPPTEAEYRASHPQALSAP